MEKLGVIYNIGHIQESFFKVMSTESGKTEELRNLAVETVSCIFPDIPEDIFNPSLNEDSNIEEAGLFVKEIYVDSATMLKRLRPAPQGRAHRIRKRSNHVTMVLGVKNNVSNS